MYNTGAVDGVAETPQNFHGVGAEVDKAVFADPLIEAIITETHTACLLSAAVMSAINALPSPGAGRGGPLLKSFVPEDPAVLLALGLRPEDDILKDETAEAIEAFFAKLDPARSALKAFLIDTHEIGAERAATLHYFALTALWRDALHYGVEAIRKIDDDTKCELPSIYHQSAAILLRTLEHALSGGKPCLTDDGRPFLPMLPQRRRSARRMLQQTCTIYYRGRTAKALAYDVSRGGFGLRQLNCELPASIELELPDGRRFSAAVIWQNGEAAGVRLDKPLRPNDPLLWG